MNPAPPRRPTAADLRRQAERAAEEVKRWPRWMRELASPPKKNCDVDRRDRAELEADTRADHEAMWG